MELAIVGGGLAGLCAAWLLQDEHHVTLFERQTRLGGHCHTVEVENGGVTVPVEAGVRYFTRRSHPHAVALMELLGLEPQVRRTSFTIVDQARDQIQRLPPRSAREILGLLGTPRRIRELLCLRRTMSSGSRLVDRGDWSHTLTEYLDAGGVPRGVTDEFMVPFFAAAWGAPPEIIASFPLHDLVKVARGGIRHFLALTGGMRTYVGRLVAQLDRVDIRTAATVLRVAPGDAGPLDLYFDGGGRRSFDAVILATSPRIASAVLQPGPALTPLRRLLGQFRHFDAEIAIHGDVRLMPPDRRDWSTCNHFYGIPRPYMTEWSGEHVDEPIFRTWLSPDTPVPDRVHHHERFEHLVVTRDTPALQRELAALQGHHGVHLAGMYVTDVDHHESALLSALAIADRLSPRAGRLAELRAQARAGAQTRTQPGLRAKKKYIGVNTPERPPAISPSAASNKSS